VIGEAGKGIPMAEAIIIKTINDQGNYEISPMEWSLVI
jgi:hypothetical protein